MPLLNDRGMLDATEGDTCSRFEVCLDEKACCLVCILQHLLMFCRSTLKVIWV
jgi:hypothetical protein